MTKYEQLVNDCLTSLTFSLMNLLILRKRVQPIIGFSAFRRLELIQEELEEVINAFQRSINY